MNGESKNDNLKENLRPKIEIVFERTEIDYEIEKKALDELMSDINLRYINSRELFFDGKNYIKPKDVSDFASLPSIYKNEILENTLSVCDLISPPVPIEQFVLENRIADLKDYLKTKWYFYERGGVVYNVSPEAIVKPTKHIYYKFFLPFVLRHCRPENVSDILYYHKDKYYTDGPQALISTVQRFVNEKSKDFWFQNSTFERITDWISENLPEKVSEETSYWFELLPKYEEHKKKILGNIYKELKAESPKFIDPSTKFHEFTALFRKTNDFYSENRKVNWKGSIGELNYFINNIKYNLSTSKIWVTAERCFLIQNKPVTADQINNNRSISRDRAAIIDKICHSFKTNLPT